MPPKGFRRGLPPPGYVFKQKDAAIRFEGQNHSGDVPLANAPKRDWIGYESSGSRSPVKKRPRTEAGTPSGSHKKKTSHHKRESVSQDRRIERGGGPQWNADEEEEEEAEEEEQQQEDEEDPEDPVWVGFREDFYEIVDQLPLELQRSFALLRQLDEQVDSNTTELSTLVRQYIDKRLGHVPPSLPPPSPSAITSPSSHHPTVAESEGNAVAGPSGYNGSMDVDDEDEEAVAAAVEPEPSKDPSLPPPSPSAAISAIDFAPLSSLPAPISQKASLGDDSLDPLDLLTSPASASNPPKSPSRGSPSVVPATPSPTKTHPHLPLAKTDSAPDPLSLSQESNPDPLPSSTSAVDPQPPSALDSTSTPTLLLPTTTSSTSQYQPPNQQQQKEHQLSRIANLLTLLLKAGEEKVAVAKGAYDRVDRQIRSLDSALQTHAASITTEALAALAASASAAAPARKEPKEVEDEQPQEQEDGFDNDADEGEFQPEDEEQEQEQARKAAEERRSSSRRASSTSAPVRKANRAAADEDFKTDSEAEDEEDEDGDWEVSLGIVGGGARKPVSERAGRKRGKGKGKGRSSKGGRKSGRASAAAGEVARGAVFSEKGLEGMAVDPFEPRYCYCQNVSYGEMIGCDNEECPSEWFHLQCVGMTTPVVGKWFCRDCDPHRFTKKRLI